MFLALNVLAQKISLQRDWFLMPAIFDINFHPINAGGSY
jgi:hypothetical protein